MDPRLTGRVHALRIAFGLTATLAGLDKFFNVLVDWSTYVSPVAVRDVVMSIAALTLARLLELRQEVSAPLLQTTAPHRSITA